MKEQFEKHIRSYQILTDEEVRLIVDGTNVQAFTAGTYLIKEGQIATKCYLILKGCIREYYLKDGQEKSTAFFTEGDSVASFSSQSNNTPSKYNLVCVEDCVLTVSTKNLEKQMCEKVPRLESMILKTVEQIMGKKQDELAAFISSSPEERYQNLIANRPHLFNRIPQHQIASYIGIKPESLSRLRKRLHERK